MARAIPIPTWKTVVVILSLLFLWPVGLILMIIWMKWPIWAKILVAIGTALVAAAIALTVISVMASVLKSFYHPFNCGGYKDGIYYDGYCKN